MPNALECMAAADVMIASESDFSRVAATLSVNVKVLTDRWEVDEDEAMIALNPAIAMAGMLPAERAELQKIVEEKHECSKSRTAS